MPSSCGKWMHLFTDIGFAENICRRAVLEGAVAECQHNAAESFCAGVRGVICLYLNCDDAAAHRRALGLMIENGLTRKTKSGKPYTIGFKLDDHTRTGEYGPGFKAATKLSEFVDMESGEFLPGVLREVRAQVDFAVRRRGRVVGI